MKKKFMPFLIAGITITSISFQNATAQSWNITGNGNANASSKLGTTNADPLRLFTNNLERIHIDPTGNVGIGNLNPVNILTVQSSGGTPASSWLNGLNSPIFMGFADDVSCEHVLAAASNTSTRRPIFHGSRSRGTLDAPRVVANNDFLTSMLASGFDGGNFQNPATIDFFVDGSPSSGHVPARISFVTGTNSTDRLERLKVGSTGNFNFNNNQLFIQHSNGNIGIGTTSPSARLHVAGTSLFTNTLSVSDGGISSSNSTGTALYGNSTATYGYGVYGNSGYLGVYGYGGSFGVYGASSGSYGIYGYSSGTSGNGVYGSGYYGVAGSGTYGVYGNGSSYGVYGLTSSGSGVYGYSSSGYGVFGSSGYLGVYGSGTSYGNFGYSSAGNGSYGSSSTGNGVYGYSGSSYGGNFYSYSGWALKAEANTGYYAAVFYGNVYASGSYLTSDKNLKKNIQDFSSAMSIINKLKPKYYEFKDDAKYASLHLPKGNHYGLLAQDLEEVLPNLVNESKHEIIDRSATSPAATNGKAPTLATDQKVTKDSLTIKAVNYIELIPIMIKAMQEQDVAMEAKDKQITTLQNQLDDLQNLLVKQGLISKSQLNNNTTDNTFSKASLGQSAPNPSNGVTTVSYFLPDEVKNASILISSINGAVLKSYPISQKGNGQLTINSKDLAAGVYVYTLVLNGNNFASKKMVVLK